MILKKFGKKTANLEDQTTRLWKLPTELENGKEYDFFK